GNEGERTGGQREDPESVHRGETIDEAPVPGKGRALRRCAYPLTGTGGGLARRRRLGRRSGGLGRRRLADRGRGRPRGLRGRLLRRSLGGGLGRRLGGGAARGGGLRRRGLGSGGLRRGGLGRGGLLRRSRRGLLRGGDLRHLAT